MRELYLQIKTTHKLLHTPEEVKRQEGESSFFSLRNHKWKERRKWERKKEESERERKKKVGEKEREEFENDEIRKWFFSRGRR